MDAVQAELDLDRDFGPLVEEFGLFPVRSAATSRAEYLLRPDLGRRLENDSGQFDPRPWCPGKPDLQVVIGERPVRDGGGGAGAALAAAAATRGSEVRLGVWPALRGAALSGRCPERCRRTARPQGGGAAHRRAAGVGDGGKFIGFTWPTDHARGHTDAQRNLLSNIHSRGVSPTEAARRILALAEKMRAEQASGVGIKENR